MHQYYTVFLVGLFKEKKKKNMKFMKCVVATLSYSFKGGPEVIIYCSVVGGGPPAGKLFLLQETVSKISLSSKNVRNPTFCTHFRDQNANPS